MDEAKKQFLINNLADDIRKAQPDVQVRNKYFRLAAVLGRNFSTE